jgi:hypothetical protein
VSTTGWEGNPIKEAVAEQEEYIKRQGSCRGQLGRSHDWWKVPAKQPWIECRACSVTQTRDDYKIKKEQQ